MSLRVRGPLPAGEVRRGPGGAPMPAMDDGYMSRLVKLVPAEAIGPFPFFLDYANKFAPTDGSPRWSVYFVCIVLMLIVVVLRAQATREPGRGVQWGAVLIAAVAFFIFVHVMGGDFGFEQVINKMASGAGPDGISRTSGSTGGASDPAEIRKFVSNVALMAWTTLAPVVYKGEDGTGEPNH